MRISSNYREFVSFQLNGTPYILGLHNDVGANIWRIDEGPNGRLTFNLVKYGQKMSAHNTHLVPFYIDGHPYIFAVHVGSGGKYLGEGVGANIWRVEDKPADGLKLVMYGKDFHRYYDYLSSFHLNGEPYLFAVKLIPPGAALFRMEIPIIDIVPAIVDDVQTSPGGFGVIFKIEGDPLKPDLRRMTDGIPISHRYRAMTTFEQGGKAYIFGIHEEGYANIWRVFEDEPKKGFTLEYYGKNPRRPGT